MKTFKGRPDSNPLFLKNNPLAGLILIIFILMFSYFTIQTITRPTKILTDISPFSLVQAYQYLKIISKNPHSSGTEAHEELRQYILDFCKKKGLITYSNEEIGIKTGNGQLIAGISKNIIAIRKGSSSHKSVLVTCHYDSQPNTPGASDDGINIAGIMETINILSRTSAVKNDIIFLFTDLEESGQLGAEAFLHSFKNINHIGTILNFEARGNDGPGYTFETSKNNGWIIRELLKATDKPFANSLAYEVYKKMPNTTDFSVLKETGVQGLNNSLIGGYSYYHSPADNIKNLDETTFRNQGELILNLVRHFGNLNFKEKEKDDLVFFNPISSWIWIYPIQWDYIFITITLLLFVAMYMLVAYKKLITVKNFIACTALYIIIILCTISISWLFQKTITTLYPAYTNFYSSAFYNIHFYFLAFLGIVFLIFGYTANKFISKYSSESLFIAALFIQMLLMLLIKFVFPTGAYIIYIPTLPIIIISIFFYIKNINSQRRVFIFTVGNIFMFILPIGIWGSFAYVLYIVFSIEFIYPSVFILCLFFPLFINLWLLTQETSTRLIQIAGVIIILSGLVSGHLTSQKTLKKPFQTQLMYAIDLDTRKAMWISRQNSKDEWLTKYIPDQKKNKFHEFYPGANFEVWKHSAVLIHTDSMKTSIKNDTIIEGKRRLQLFIKGNTHTNSIDLYLPPHTSITKIDNRTIDPEQPIRKLSYYAFPLAGSTIELNSNPRNLEMQLIERRIGLPKDLLTYELPGSFIFGPGYDSNTVQIKRTISMKKNKL